MIGFTRHFLLILVAIVAVAVASLPSDVQYVFTPRMHVFHTLFHRLEETLPTTSSYSFLLPFFLHSLQMPSM